MEIKKVTCFVRGFYLSISWLSFSRPLNLGAHYEDQMDYKLNSSGKFSGEIVVKPA